MIKAIKTNKKTALVLFLIIALVAGLIPIAMRAASREAFAEEGPAGALEVNVTGFPQFHEGNPQIAWNTKDPNNLVFVATCTSPWLTQLDPLWRYSMCQVVYYSNDRGATWNLTEFPFDGYAGAGVASVLCDSDGTFYMHYNALRGRVPEDDATSSWTNPTLVSISKDGGVTWSKPVETYFSMTGQPRSAYDPTTGKYYITGASGGITSPTRLSYSVDGGLTFSAPLGDTTTASGGIAGGNIAAYGGILATLYQDIAGDFVGFAVTTDDGVTWEHNQVQYIDHTGVMVPALPGIGLVNAPGVNTGPYSYSDNIYLAADPTKAGRFSIMLPRKGTTNTDMIILDVYTTEDSGKTWSAPNRIITIDACRPDMAYGPTGALGIMWRTHAVDAFAVVSFDAGKTFSRPVQLNSRTRPLGDSGPMSDHYSDIVLDAEYAYIGWADCRGGGALDAIFARVPLTAFKPLPATPFPTAVTGPMAPFGMELPLDGSVGDEDAVTDEGTTDDGVSDAGTADGEVADDIEDSTSATDIEHDLIE